MYCLLNYLLKKFFKKQILNVKFKNELAKLNI